MSNTPLVHMGYKWSTNGYNIKSINTRNSKHTRTTRVFHYETSYAYNDVGVFNQNLNKGSRHYDTNASFPYNIFKIRLCNLK